MAICLPPASTTLPLPAGISLAFATLTNALILDPPRSAAMLALQPYCLAGSCGFIACQSESQHLPGVQRRLVISGAAFDFGSEPPQMGSRGRHESGPLFLNVHARPAPGFFAGFAAFDETEPPGGTAEALRPLHRRPGDAPKRKPERSALAIQPHLEVALRRAADPVHHQRRGSFFGEPQRHQDYHIAGVSGVCSGNLSGESGRKRAEKVTHQIERVRTEFIKSGLLERRPPCHFLYRRRMEHLLPALNEIETAKFAAVEPLARPAVNRHVAVLVVYREKPSVRAGGGDDFIGFGKCAHEGLFAKDVRAVREAQKAKIAVGVRRRA